MNLPIAPRPRAAGLLACTGLACACATSPRSAGPLQPPLAERLLVPAESVQLASHPELVARLRSDPHAYFRFTNTRFARLVCEWYAPRFQARRPGGEPLEVALHGDAHVEQYAVTGWGRGLTDFDDASRGPAVLDLLRMGVSLRLAARLNGWEAEEEGLFSAFLDGYRSGLRNPGRTPPEPPFVGRVRGGLGTDRLEHLAWAESLMEPVPPQVEAEVRRELRQLGENLLAPAAEASSAYFQPVRVGRLRLGVGSALDTKYLVRLRGATDDPADDDVLELKAVRDLGGIPCVESRPGDPYRVITGERRMAYTPLRLVGYVRIGGRYYWTHAWSTGYREVEARGTLRSAAELAELARDAGIQLGLGHPRLVPEPFARRTREAHLSLVEGRREALAQASRELTAALLEAWRRFARTASATPAAPSATATGGGPE